MEPLLLPARASSLLEKSRALTHKVARVFAQYSTSRATALEGDLKKQLEVVRLQKVVLTTSRRQYRLAQQKGRALTKQIKCLSLKKPKLIATYETIMQKLLDTGHIEAFVVDTRKRIIVTTTPLRVKKDSWKRSRCAGRYQIRIDFSSPRYDSGIRILNITKAYQDYDSPTISDTKPCWGNIGPDIEREFAMHDVFQLIMDLVDYIKSPNDALGYIYLPKHDKSTGWEQFFLKAKNRDADYCFRINDRENKRGRPLTLSYISERIELSGASPVHAPPLTVSNQLDSTYYNISSASTIAYANLDYTSTHIYPTQIRLTPAQEHIKDELIIIGFVQDAAYRFAPLIAPEGPEMPMEMVIRRDGSNFATLDIFRDSPPGYFMGEGMLRSVTYGQHNEPYHGRRERLGVNRPDVEPSFWDRLTHERFSYQFHVFQQRRVMQERPETPVAAARQQLESLSADMSMNEQRYNSLASAMGQYANTMASALGATIPASIRGEEGLSAAQQASLELRVGVTPGSIQPTTASLNDEDELLASRLSTRPETTARFIDAEQAEQAEINTVSPDWGDAQT